MRHIFDNDTSDYSVTIERRCDTDVDSVMSCHSYVFFEKNYGRILSAPPEAGAMFLFVMRR